jgi:hypothetical protein
MAKLKTRHFKSLHRSGHQLIQAGGREAFLRLEAVVGVWSGELKLAGEK